jgi:hypothetical protein
MKFLAQITDWIRNMTLRISSQKNVVVSREIKPTKKLPAEKISTPTIGAFTAGQMSLFWVI